MPAILDGTDNPGKVFDRTVTLDVVPEAYRAIGRPRSLQGHDHLLSSRPALPRTIHHHLKGTP
jgi:hypothetical protein